MAYVRALLSENRAKLDRLAEKLMEKEILDSEEVEALIRDGTGAVAAS
jgi:ATP-dependent Zn protease